MCTCELDNRHYKYVFYCQRCIITMFDVSMKLLGPLLIVSATVLIGGVAVIYFRSILPLVARPLGAPWALLGTTGLFLLYNVAFNYYMCVLTPAGTPATAPAPWRADAKLRALLHEEEAGICGDSSSSSSSASSKGMPSDDDDDDVCAAFGGEDDDGDEDGGGGGDGDVSCGLAAGGLEPHVLRDPFVLVLAASAGLAVLCLLAFHVFLILRGETTIEYYQNRNKAKYLRRRGQVFINPYDLGRARNWEQVFGLGTGANLRAVLLSTLPSRRKPPPPHEPDLGAFDEAEMQDRA
eukprot:g4624.t1